MKFVKLLRQFQIMKRTFALLLCCFLLMTSYVLQPIQAKAEKNTDVSNAFRDVSQNQWFYESVDYAYNHGLFFGTSETTFEPETKMTRGMFVTVLGRMHGVDPEQSTTIFKDVPETQYYSGYVNWANENGIVNGTSANTFNPEEPVTREQICKMMVEYCRVSNIALQPVNQAAAFKDFSAISAWAKAYVTTCQKASVINGWNGYFYPQDHATRAEVATILMNFADVTTDPETGTAITVVKVVEKTNDSELKVITTYYSDGSSVSVVECQYCHETPCPTGGGRNCSLYSEDQGSTPGVQPGYCQYCGKKEWDGTNGTCLRYWGGGDHNCPNCGVLVPVNTCHTCD